jgi:hypothetical protein
LSTSQVRQFREQGFIVLPGLLDVASDLEPFIAEYRELAAQLCRAYAPAFAEEDFDTQLRQLFRQMGGSLHHHLDICLPQKGVTENSPVHTGPATFALLKHPKLLDAVTVLVGPDIYSNPTQHVRIKPPAVQVDGESTVTAEVATTVWHQDLATIMPEADNSNIVTVWIAVTEATRRKGCLLVAPGSHRRGIAVHCHDPRTNYSRQAIPDALVGEERVALETQPGDVVLLDKLTMHESLPNQSDRIRWSLDLRYQPAGEPTGRPWFPGFVARCGTGAGQVLDSAREWTALWDAARQQMIENPPDSFQRWPEGNPDCA